MGATYEPRDIEVLEGLEPIRKRPGMYVGDLRDSRTVSRCIAEAVRTFLHTGASRVIVTIEDDTRFEIVGEDARVPADTLSLRTVFSTMHCGCECIRERRVFVEACNPAVTNALCEAFDVEASADGARARVCWKKGVAVSDERSDCSAARRMVRVRGALDLGIFGVNARIVADELDALLDDLAVLAAGTRIHMLDARSGATHEHHAPNGLVDRLVARGVAEPLLAHLARVDGTSLAIALGWVEDGPARVDAWAVGWWNQLRQDDLAPALVGTMATALLPERCLFEPGPGARLPENVARGLVGAIAIDVGVGSKVGLDELVREALEPVLAPYVLARPALLAQLARNTGCTTEELAARLDSRIPH
ncbi:hypothetical protein [Sandaracinus amylolyticus]|nr:hypothetical protein [Sandaracinus amylolyticus]